MKHTKCRYKINEYYIYFVFIVQIILMEIVVYLLQNIPRANRQFEWQSTPHDKSNIDNLDNE